MKKIILIFTLIFTFLGGFLFFTSFASAQDDYGLSAIAGKADLKNAGDLPTLSGQVLGAVLSLVGIVFFLLMIYGGILWMTARGNSQQTDKSLNIIIAAVIGLIIVLGSYTITKFLFTSIESAGSETGCVEAELVPLTPCNVVCSSYTTEPTCLNTNLCCEWK